MKVKRLSSASLMFREGILVIEFTERATIDVREAEEQLEAAKKLTSGTACPVIIIDHHASTKISPEGREVLSNSKNVFTRISEAYVSASLAKRNLANIYVKYQKPENPSQVFSSFNEAWNWSSSMIENKENPAVGS